MSPVEIATAIVGVVLTGTRFAEASKPLWSRLPKPAAVILPVLVAMAPQVVALVSGAKTVSDLVTQLIAAGALVVVNLFPRHDAPPVVS